ncbi:MAG: hypothetical protein A2Y62_20780 [Candidatus Fischerbacteria bacterium RBG_13_37_8]|uniref:DUF2339 domain-containing protein n=1 Tax=Candidatus Fischerbacteria bacterium RBG_13_37_8 TaxID=1817863 RepID=A0A1F5VXU5_9BACT|nr:MAG: hypothetical protein A2Y62_20780 [Candidatus Fischerbacteria bacterium RBG_13_37_8]
MWIVIWLSHLYQPSHTIWIESFLLASTAIFVIADYFKKTPAGEKPQLLTWFSLASSIVLMGVLTVINNYHLTQWLIMTIFGFACLILARIKPAYIMLAYLAAIIPAIMLFFWSFSPLEMLPEFLWASLLLGVFYAGLSYLLMWNSTAPHRWALLSSVTAILYYLIAYWGQVHSKEKFPWGICALIVAAVYFILSIPLAKKRQSQKTIELAFSSIAVASIFFITIAIPIELKREWFAIAWALEAVAIIWIDKRLNTETLHRASIFPTMLVMYQLLFNPAIFRYPAGDHPVWNWLILNHVIAIIAFIIGAYLCYGRKEVIIFSRLFHWCAVILTVGFTIRETNLLFHKNASWHFLEILEYGVLTTAWLILTLLFLFLYKHFKIRDFYIQIRIFFLASFFQAIAILSFARNPLWHHEAIGTTAFIINDLVLIYAIPAVLFIIIARRINTTEDKKLAHLSTITGIVLLFFFVTTEIRWFFHGAYLDTGFATYAEKYSYSLAWLLFGVILLILGMLKKGSLFRYYSLPIMALTVGKVFLYDASQLKDLYRMLSFLGLGISLLALAYIYQKFVFKPEQNKAT